MRQAAIWTTFVSLGLLGLSLVVTLAWPQHRVWPPPRRLSWQYAYTWGLTWVGMLGIAVLGVFDWNTGDVPGWLRTSGGLVAVAGTVFTFWAVHVLGVHATQGLGGELVTTGPYRFSRNPQYVGDIALLLGFGLLANSVITLAAAALGAVWFALAPFAEEPWLRERLGDAYEEYTRRVPRFLGRPAA